MQPGMAGFLPQNLQAFTPESIDLAHLRQRQALADALLQSSATPISTQRQSGRFVSAISPLEGLTKLAEAYIGSKQHKAIEQESRDLAGNRAKRFVEALRGKQAAPASVQQNETLGAPFDPDATDKTTPNPYAGAFPSPPERQWQDPTRPTSALQANRVEAGGHGLAAFLPIVGPAAAAVGESGPDAQAARVSAAALPFVILTTPVVIVIAPSPDAVAMACRMFGPFANTAAPVPVSSASAEARSALESVLSLAAMLRVMVPVSVVISYRRTASNGPTV